MLKRAKLFAVSISLTGILMLFSATSLIAFGKRSVGASGAQFLKLPVNARAIGMGEAYSAIADGSDAIYWNPAGLDRVKGKSLSLMHAVYFGNIYYDFASYAHRIGKWGTVGTGIQYLSGPSIDQVDESNTNVGTFKPYDLAVSLGWAMKLKDFADDQEFAIGISGKFIQSKIIKSAIGGAVDFGVSWVPLDKLWVSMAVQNVGPNITFVDQGDDLPLNLKIGSSYTLFESLILGLDLNFPRDNDPNVAIGTEYKRMVSQELWVAGRFGFNSRTLKDINKISSISSGFGIGLGRYGIDFAWVPFGDLGHTFRISLSVKF